MNKPGATASCSLALHSPNHLAPTFFSSTSTIDLKKSFNFLSLFSSEQTRGVFTAVEGRCTKPHLFWSEEAWKKRKSGQNCQKKLCHEKKKKPAASNAPQLAQELQLSGAAPDFPGLQNPIPAEMPVR